MYRYDLTAQAWEELETGIGSGFIQLSFFGSIMKDDHWIIFPGWNGFQNSDTIWRVELPQPGSNTVNWKEIPRTLDDAFLEGVVIDAYAFAHIEPYVYFHAGYSDTHPTGNFISRLNINEEPLKAEIISPSYDMPAGRSYHSITAIGNKLYMFGGHDGDKALDELWSFDVDNEHWEYIEIKGIKPSRRLGHAATSHGTNLLIWGGKNGNLLYNDMFMYNVFSKKWTELETKSDLYPPAVEGA